MTPGGMLKKLHCAIKQERKISNSSFEAHGDKDVGTHEERYLCSDSTNTMNETPMEMPMNFSVSVQVRSLN